MEDTLLQQVKANPGWATETIAELSHMMRQLQRQRAACTCARIALAAEWKSAADRVTREAQVRGTRFTFCAMDETTQFDQLAQEVGWDGDGRPVP